MNYQSLRGNASILVSALYLALFFSGFLSFVGTWANGKAPLLPVLIYLVYGAGCALAISAVALDVAPRRFLLRVLFYCILAASPLFLGENRLDSVEKSYLVGICSIFVFTSVAVAGNALVTGRFAASLVLLGSLFCLFDACFLDGLTNTTGRAAALFVNPNVAALTLLTGATGSIWAVPPRWRAAFLVVVAGGVFCTLSRSAMLLGALTLLASLPLLMVRSKRAAILKDLRLGRAALALLAVCGLLTFAFLNNKAVSVASKDAFHGLIVAKSVWAESQFGRSFLWSPSEVVLCEMVRDAPATGGDVAEGCSPTLDTSQAETRAGENQQSQDAPQILARIEKENSAAARAALMQRALAEYQSGPSTGLGLDRALELAPHNSYLFFAVAFGHLGWLIVPIFALLILSIAGLQRGLPSAVLISGASFFSHDIFVALPLVAGLIVILSGLIGERINQFDECDGVNRVTALVALLCAAASLVATNGVSDMLTTYRTTIDAARVGHLGGVAYYAALTPPNPPGLFRIVNSREPSNMPSVYAEGELIGNCDSSVVEVVLRGEGRCNSDGHNVVFSTPNNTSPLEDSRSYSFAAPVSLHPLLVVLVVTVQLWAFLWCAIAFRRNVS